MLIWTSIIPKNTTEKEGLFQRVGQFAGGLLAGGLCGFCSHPYLTVKFVFKPKVLWKVKMAKVS